MEKSSPLGRLAGLLVISVLVLAMTGLFGVWSTHRKAEAALREANRLAALTEAARTAQVDFKTEVQLWKNLLLRGQAGEQFQDYKTRLLQQQEKVDASVDALEKMHSLPPDIVAGIAQIRAGHATVTEAYIRGADAYVTGDPASIFRVDASVQGVDQALNARFDDLADALAAHREKGLRELTKQSEKYYHTLSLVTMIVGGIASIIAIVMAWKAVRARS